LNLCWLNIAQESFVFFQFDHLLLNCTCSCTIYGTIFHMWYAAIPLKVYIYTDPEECSGSD
jgi:hypothetical protein